MSRIDQLALEHFRQVVSPSHEAARLYAEGAVSLAAGDAEGAAASFAAALATKETGFHLKVAHGLCEALLELGRAAEAEPIAQALLAERPDLLTTYLLVGRCLLQLGRPSEALAVHRQAVERDVGEPGDRVRVAADGAIALDRLGRYAEGERWCLDALERLPDPHPVLYVNLAGFRFRLGRQSAAREALRAARELAPDVATTVESTWATYGDGSPL
jgi:tetratricopeptide (TPR) repeat protein